MLAGYLPFDDDPANPEGDNINLLYKYITTTPLTFPEYVTPHARDLLRRILVPDPRKRADLFEVARHSWLSEYHHVVSHITSSTTNIADIANSTVPAGKVTFRCSRICSNSDQKNLKKHLNSCAVHLLESPLKHTQVLHQLADSVIVKAKSCRTNKMKAPNQHVIPKDVLCKSNMSRRNHRPLEAKRHLFLQPVEPIIKLI